MPASLVLTAIGPDRPGIVNQISDVAQRFGANWAGSRMANLAGQFAGMVHFEVADDKADALAEALGALQSSGLRIVIARTQASAAAPVRRRVRLEIVGHDRPGIVRDLSGNLAQRGVSIEELDTQVASAAMSGEHLFKVKALLAVPAELPNEELQRGLEALANEMMVDLELGEAPGG
ncbi:MAG TPA: ACT domain-containing protein [Usitatibacteraceae bacterium]|nr:ACT domain-containing protein [Usitatibacteraceae bacterium]